MILKSHDLDKWVAKYFVSKMKHIEILKKRRKDTEKCTIQYLFSMSVSFPYHFSIFSVSEFFIGQVLWYPQVSKSKCYIMLVNHSAGCPLADSCILLIIIDHLRNLVEV